MATQNAVSVPTKRLQAAILSTDMSFTLNNILSWKGLVDGTTNLVSADFGAYGRGAFRNASNTQIEFFTFDPTTIANATITILARGCSYSGGTADGATTKYGWPASTTLVELGANVPALFEDYVDKTSDETIAGLKTYSTLPQSTAVPAANADLVNKLYADTHGGAATSYDQNIMAGIAGEALTAGWAVYLKTSDGKWYGTLATGSSTSEGVLLGIAQATVSSGAAVNVLVGGVDKLQSGLVAGTVYYLSNTKGLIASSAGTKSVVIGQCNTITTQLILSQRFTQVPSKDFNDAFAGDLGTPSATNKYLTQTSLPTGSMTMYVSAAAPTGWVLCDGSSLLRAGTYANLFAVIGTTYGTADGTHFNVPDMRGRIPYGVGTGTGGGASGTGLPTGGNALTAVSLGTWKGEETHVLVTAELAAHNHTIYLSGSANPGFSTGNGLAPAQGSTSNLGTTANTGSDTAHNNLQPVMGVNFIIKI